MSNAGTQKPTTFRTNSQATKYAIFTRRVSRCTKPTFCSFTVQIAAGVVLVLSVCFVVHSRSIGRHYFYSWQYRSLAFCLQTHLHELTYSGGGGRGGGRETA